jgi:hypothetical protein
MKPEQHGTGQSRPVFLLSARLRDRTWHRQCQDIALVFEISRRDETTGSY